MPLESYVIGLYLIPYLEITGKIPLVFTIILWLLLLLLLLIERREGDFFFSFCHICDNEAATILYHFASDLFLQALTNRYSIPFLFAENRFQEPSGCLKLCIVLNSTYNIFFLYIHTYLRSSLIYALGTVKV